MSGTMLYSPGVSQLHRADPRAKMLVVLGVMMCALTTTRIDVLLLILAVVVAGLHLLGNIGLTSYWKVLTAVVPLIALLVLLQSIIQSGPALATIAGIELSRNGFLLGLGIGIRLIALGICFYGFSVVTSPTDISLALHRAGIPYKYAYLTSFAFRFLPLMQDEARTLLTAMAVRGSSDTAAKNPVVRVRALVRMLFPMLVGALRRSGDTALSMELRGYSQGGPRTFIRTLRFTRSDYALVAGAVLLGVTTVLLRLYHLG
ncbi:energy-coupling factor transport system permease protein [Rhodococcus wratislaviensis]|uniref:Energy-coupling factor transporter transmembrane protein EcfT n=1 Tax=Rhodococcus wratislaviensis TaxID=44752 RepID=A0AB38FD89_RHOWR|nr:energy-coupling factor transporter transmembrane component T [Rhodococcus wratislaviensis]REE75462.1 energy-coupling factor transport system permease protein [Rhodococcus wratislaviensis]SPZ39504.1 Energy-coupling factor transporter transmembrane protein EcfT [Rhodococcus wratislaviensis]